MTRRLLEPPAWRLSWTWLVLVVQARPVFSTIVLTPLLRSTHRYGSINPLSCINSSSMHVECWSKTWMHRPYFESSAEICWFQRLLMGCLKCSHGRKLNSRHIHVTEITLLWRWRLTSEDTNDNFISEILFRKFSVIHRKLYRYFGNFISEILFRKESVIHLKTKYFRNFI